MLNKALINLSNKNAVLKETMTTESSNAQLARGDMELGSCILCLHPQDNTHQLWTHLYIVLMESHNFISSATYRTHSSGTVRENMVVNATYIV